MTLVAVALIAPGCGDDKSNTTTQATLPATTEQTTPQEPPSTPATQPTQFPKAQKVQPSPGEADPNKKPKITVPQGPPPKKLVVQDLIVGSVKMCIRDSAGTRSLGLSNRIGRASYRNATGPAPTVRDRVRSHHQYA